MDPSMMNPQMIAQAQRMMASMSPAQRQAMMQQMASMDPATIANMSRMTGQANLNVDDIKRAQAQMNGMSPEQLEQASNMAAAHAQRASASSASAAPAQSPGEANATRQKEEGNTHFRAGRYHEALKCYRRAIAGLVDQDSAASRDIVKACRLNAALCQVKNGEPEEAIDLCSQVLKAGANMKAHYRRGLAYELLEDYAASLRDMEAAMALTPDDSTLKSAYERVKKYAAEAEPAAAEAGDDETRDASSSRAQEDPVAAGDTGDTPEQQKSKPSPAPAGAAAEATTAAATPKSTPKPASAPKPASTPTQMPPMGAPGSMPTPTPEMMAMMQDPSYIAMVKDMLAHQSDDDLAQQAAQMGVSADQIRMARQMFSSMDPQTLAGMAKQNAAKMSATPAPAQAASAPAAPASAAAAAPSAASPLAGMGGDPSEMARQMMDNPEMLKSMTDMMKNIDPDQLAQMSKQMGMNLSPEQAKKMQAQMANMTPEQLATLTKVSARLQQAGKGFQFVYQALFGNMTRIIITLSVVVVLLAVWLGAL